MSFFNYTSSGGLFSDELREGQTNVNIFDFPGGTSPAVLAVVEAGGQEFQGIYPANAINQTPPDNYSVAADPAFTLAFSGTEYQVGAQVNKTFQWASQSLEDIRNRKLNEGESYADTVAFSSAQTNQNPNVYVITRFINLSFYWVVNWFYSDRHKDRVLGLDSANGYTPGTDPAPTSYWARNVPVRLVNANNGNRIKVNATEDEWGQVAKEVGEHFLATLDALDLYEADVESAYTTAVGSGLPADRDALAALDPTDQVYGWPPFYEPTSGFSQLARFDDIPSGP